MAFKKPAQNFFLSVITALLFCATAPVLYYFPFHFIPDYWGLASYTKTYELLSLIISSLTSLIGIYITVTLVAYEFFRQKSGIELHKSLLLNQSSSIFTAFCVATIITAFISSLAIAFDHPSGGDLTLIYYNSFLFLGVIMFLFPAAINLFSSLNPGKLADMEISKITSTDVFLSREDRTDIHLQAETIENDPILKVQSIILSLIAASERVKAQLIIIKCASKTNRLIIGCKNREEKRYMVQRLLGFYFSIIDFTLQQPAGSSVLKAVWRSAEQLYADLIIEKVYSYELKEFRQEFFSRYFNRLWEQEELMFYGIESMKNIMERQLAENTADESELIVLYSLRSDIEPEFKMPEFKTGDAEKSEQFQEIAVHFLHLFSDIMYKAVRLDRPEILHKCIGELNALLHSLSSDDEGGPYMELFLRLKCADLIYDAVYEGFKENLYENSALPLELMPYFLDHAAEYNKLYARFVLQKYCRMMIRLQKIGRLDRKLLGGYDMGYLIIEGDLGQMARRCIVNYQKNKTVQDCLDDIIQTFKILKEFYETDSIKNFDIYSVVKIRLETILEFMKEKNPQCRTVQKKLRDIIKSFKSKDTFEGAA
jgi:hypothetical protein